MHSFLLVLPASCCQKESPVDVRITWVSHYMLPVSETVNLVRRDDKMKQILKIHFILTVCGLKEKESLLAVSVRM